MPDVSKSDLRHRSLLNSLRLLERWWGCSPVISDDTRKGPTYRLPRFSFAQRITFACHVREGRRLFHVTRYSILSDAVSTSPVAAKSYLALDNTPNLDCPNSYAVSILHIHHHGCMWNSDAQDSAKQDEKVRVLHDCIDVVKGPALGTWLTFPMICTDHESCSENAFSGPRTSEATLLGGVYIYRNMTHTQRAGSHVN